MRSLDDKASVAIFCPRSRNDQLQSRLCRMQVTTASALWPCLQVLLRSRQPLRHIRHWISWKPLEIEASFQRTTNEMVYGESVSHVTMQWRLVTRKVKLVTTIRSEPNIFENSWRSNSATIANYKIVCCEAVRSAILATASSSSVNDVIHSIIFRTR